MSDILALADAINNLAAAISGNPIAAPTAEQPAATAPRRGRPPKASTAPSVAPSSTPTAASTPPAAAPSPAAPSAPAPAPAAAQPAPAVPAAAVTPSAETPAAPALSDKAPEATKDAASNALVRLIMAAKRNDVVAILGAHHAANVSALPENPKIYGDIVNKAAQVLGVTMEAAGLPIPKQA